MQFKNNVLTGFMAFILLLAPGLSFADVGQASKEVGQEIAQLLETDGLEIEGAVILTQTVIQQIYQKHDYAPFWTDPNSVAELMSLIGNSPDHGLNPADYYYDLLQSLEQRQASSPSAYLSAEEEILLTESLLRYAYHRRHGKIKANELDPDINFRRETFNHQSTSESIEQLLDSSSLADFIQVVAPTGPFYRGLQAVLDRYRDIAEMGGWPVVSTGPTLRKGDQGPRVRTIRRRLSISGELDAGENEPSDEFDEQLENAVRIFQKRHALEDDGLAGKQTILAMNISVEARIDQLRISLERLRWVNQVGSETLVAVNIAGFRAFYYHEGQLKWSTRAMVGKNYRQTPVFRGDMAYLEFNPTWTIPPGILRNDTLPAIKRDPNYLASKNIRVIDKQGNFIDPSSVDWNLYSKGIPYTLRQDPGPNNSLGTVKFIFPNQHFVFLHDTPHRELFVHSERAFSSGCIRVEDPLALAELVFNNYEKYPRSELEKIVDSRKTQRISLSPKIPVIILYLTASVGEAGEPFFYKDIYDRDQKVLDALNGPVILIPPKQG
jgi:murein L,D-transpeptidase YcbB/YkuD